MEERRTPRGRKIQGVCSRYLTKLQYGDIVPVRIRGGSLRVPQLDKPIILIGPGTGVAPMRAIFMERLHMYYKLQSALRDARVRKQYDPMNSMNDMYIVNNSMLNNPVKNTSNVHMNDGDLNTTLQKCNQIAAATYLFFGCRKESKDFLYQNEWNSLEYVNSSSPSDLQWIFCREQKETAEDGTKTVLFRIITAFSRDQEDKEYVTHKIKSFGSFLWTYIMQVQYIHPYISIYIYRYIYREREIHICVIMSSNSCM